MSGGIPILGAGVHNFNPHSITGLHWWLDASDPTTIFDSVGMANVLTDTGNCYRWLDKSSYGCDAEVVSATNPPVWTTAQQNGLAGMVFPASAWFDALANSLPVMTSSTVFAVVNIANVAATRALIGGDNGSFECRFTTANKMEALSEGLASLGTSTNAIPTGAAALCVWEFNGSSGLFRTNGASNGGILSAHTITAQTKGVGAENLSTGFNYFQSTLFELLYYNRILTTSEAGLVETYLNAKWMIY